MFARAHEVLAVVLHFHAGILSSFYESDAFIDVLSECRYLGVGGKIRVGIS